MDKKAKSIAWNEIVSKRHLPLFLSSSLGLGTITSHEILISSRFQHSLIYIIQHDNMVKKMSCDFDIPPEILHKIVGWKSLGKARKEASIEMNKFMTKRVGVATATGIFMKQRRQRNHSDCPLCNYIDEDT